MKQIEKDLNKAVKDKFRYWRNFSAFLGYRGNFSKQAIMRMIGKLNSILNKLDVELHITKKNEL